MYVYSIVLFLNTNAFYSEKFCKFSGTRFHKCLYPQLLNSSINFRGLFFPVYLEENKIFQSYNLLKSYRKSRAKRECHDETVFLKADRAFSKLNILFYLKSKTNSVTLIKLQEINLNVCKEYKTEREARD